MFCWKCGTMIDDESVFCYQCGTETTAKKKIDYHIQDETMDFPVEESIVKKREIKKFPQKKFPLFNGEVSISEGYINYIEMRRRYYPQIEELMLQCKKEMELEIKNDNPEHILNVCRTIGNNFCAIAKEKFYSLFTDNGIYNIAFSDYDKYLSNIYETKMWADSLGNLERKINEIDHNKKDIERNREIRKATRRKFVGGGFGLRGATKGIVTAGVLNAVSGTAHSVFNTVANIGTSINTNVEKYRLIKDNSVITKFLVNLESSLFYILDNTFKYFEEVSEKMIFETVSKTDEEKVDTIVRNLEQGMISIQDEQEIIRQCIELNPFDEVVYVELLVRYPQQYSNIRGIIKTLELDYLGILDMTIEKLFGEEMTDIEESLADYFSYAPGSMNVIQLQEMLERTENIKVKINKLVDQFGFNQNELEVVYSLFTENIYGNSDECANLVELEEIHKGYIKMHIQSNELVFEEYQKMSSYDEVLKVKKIQEKIVSVFEKIDFSKNTDIGIALTRMKELDKESVCSSEVIDYLENKLKSYGNSLLPQYEDAQVINKIVPYSSLESVMSCRKAIDMLASLNISEESRQIVKQEILNKLYLYEEEYLDGIIKDVRNTEGMTADKFNQYVQIYSDYMFEGNHKEATIKIENSLKHVDESMKSKKSLGRNQIGCGFFILVVLALGSGLISGLPVILKGGIYIFAGLCVVAQLIGGMDTKNQAKDWQKQTAKAYEILYSSKPAVYSKEMKKRNSSNESKNINHSSVIQESSIADSNMRKCPMCGEIIKSGKKFCSQCGNEIGG